MTSLESGEFYSVAGNHIASRFFEEELTLINLETGGYFAAGGIVVDIWNVLTKPTRLDQLSQQVAARYDVDPAKAAQEVRNQVQQLLAHGLIASTLSPGGTEVSAFPLRPEVPAPWPGSWFEAYSDMKDLLLLDPVHDVEDGVWPPKPAGT
jgi:hypothetical protein